MSRTRRTSTFALAVGALLLVLLPACSSDGSGGAAIVVNGERISFTEFTEELEGYAENELALQSVQQQVQQTDPGATVEPTGTGTLAAPVAAQIATTRIVYTLIGQEIDERELEITDEDRDAVRAQFAQTQDPTTGQPVEGESPLDDLPDSLADQIVEDQASVAVLGEALAAEVEPAEVTDEDVAAALEATGEESCASIILTATADEAAAALARVQGGEDFATVASEVSQDQSAAEGGEIGCVSEGETVPELDEALAGLEPGGLAGPVTFTSAGPDGAPQEAFLVVRLDSRGAPSEADVRAELEAQALQAAQSQNPLNPFVEQALADADVEVASRYGTWEPEGITRADGSNSGPMVVPPEGPEAPETTSTSAADPAAGIAIDPSTGLPVEEAPVQEGG